MEGDAQAGLPATAQQDPAQGAGRRLALLAEVGRELSDSLDPQAMLERLADLMGSVENFLAKERQEEPATVTIRRGVCF